MPSAGVKGTHDITMTIASTTYGFMLVQEKGRKLWDVYDSPVVAPQFTSTEPGYGNYPPEREVVKLQTDFRAGFGRLFYSGQPEYYLPGNIDTRWKNKVLVGPGPVATTKAASAALDGAGIVFAEFGDKLYLGCANKLYKWATPTASIWNEFNDFGAGTITDLVPYNGVLFIALGTSANYAFTDGTTVWTSALTNSKAKFFAVLGTTFFKAITSNEVKTATIPQQDCTPTAPTIASIGAGGSVDTGSHYYKVIFRYAVYAEGSGGSTVRSSVGTVSAVATTTAGNNTVNLSAIQVGPSGTLGRVLCRTKVGDANTFFILADIADNTTLTYADTTADASMTQGVLAGTDGWSSAYTVGDSETDITRLINFRTLIYAGKEDALYSITSAGTVVQVLTDFRVARNTLNFTKMAVWRDKLFFNIGKGGVYVYDGENIEALSWDLLAPDVGLYAEIGGFAPSHDFLYVVIKGSGSGQNMTVCTLRQENIDGTVDWRWHGICKYAMDTPACAMVTALFPSTANPNLWIAGTDNSAGNKPVYIYLPVIGGSPENDSVYAFQTSGTLTFETCNYDMGFRADRKLFTAVDIISTHPGTGQTIAVAYAVDGATSYTAISGSITAGPVTTKYINAVGRYIRYRITMATDDSTKTPRLHGIATRAILRAARRKVYEFAVRVADEIQDRNGMIDKQVATTLASALKDADDPTVQTTAVTLYDRENTSHTIVFESMRELEVVDEVNRRPQRHFYIRAVEVKLS